MKKAVGYIRVSREDENPSNQLHAIMEWSAKNGYEVIPFTDYAVSGAVDPFQRPGFRMMLDYMKQTGIATIVVTELERLTRDVEHFEKLKDLKNILGWSVEQDIEIISITDARFTELVNQVRAMVRELRSSLPKEVSFLKPIYDMVSKILITVVEMLPEIRVSMAQAERERVRERTRIALNRIRSEGRVYTKPTLIHWLALYRSGKKELRELTREDIESARKYFHENYARYVSMGMPITRVYRRFLENEKPFIEFISRVKTGKKNKYISRTAFYTAVRRSTATPS